MATLEKAIEIAARAHREQQDKNGAPYILHPLRIMTRMPTLETMIIAVLHDVVEDSDVTLNDLRMEGFSDAIVAGVDCLTRRSREDYADYIERVKQNPLAVQVKLGDLEDNMNLQRLDRLKEADFKRVMKYHHTFQLLKNLVSGQ